MAMMLEQEDRAKAAAAGPSTLGGMAEAAAAAAAAAALDADDDDDDEEEEAPFEELAVAGSGMTGQGVLDLLRALDEALRAIMVNVEVLLPYSEASTLSLVRPPFVLCSLRPPTDMP